MKDVKRAWRKVNYKMSEVTASQGMVREVCADIPVCRNYCGCGVKPVLTALLAGVLLLLQISLAQADIHDRVVAFVDNQAITLSEFEEQYAGTLKVSPQITKEEVLGTMINRILLLKEARKYRIEAPTKEEIVREYINLKVRAFIRISDASTEEFYRQNSAQFAGREYETVRSEIETYLTEKMLNDRLKEILRDLRKSSYIRVQL